MISGGCFTIRPYKLVYESSSYIFSHCLIGIYEGFELVNLQVLSETGLWAVPSGGGGGAGGSCPQ